MLKAHKHPKGRTTRSRDPERTRQRLLQAAFHQVYRSGFQSASLDAILAAARVTKGALYYHFDSKEALGYALVEEVIAPDLRAKWLHPLQKSKDPIETLIGIVQSESVQPEDVRGGCPLNNLAQEMSPLDEGFRKRLEAVFHEWQEGVASALREGQDEILLLLACVVAFICLKRLWMAMISAVATDGSHLAAVEVSVT
jgi:AcrR family transcriptional regulator